jgi:hypothetical protein
MARAATSGLDPAEVLASAVDLALRAANARLAGFAANADPAEVEAVKRQRDTYARALDFATGG